MRIEELARSVVFLTRENQELREQNDIFRQMVVSNILFLPVLDFNTGSTVGENNSRPTSWATIKPPEIC